MLEKNKIKIYHEKRNRNETHGEWGRNLEEERRSGKERESEKERDIEGDESSIKVTEGRM